MIIREFQLNDLDEVMQIWLAGNLKAHPFVTPSYWHEHSPLVRQALLQASVIVAVSNNKIVGFAGIQNDYLAGIFVREEFQHQGVGRQLISAIKQTHSSITLEVYFANKQALHFYQQQDFKVIKERVDETGNREYLMKWE